MTTDVVKRLAAAMSGAWEDDCQPGTDDERRHAEFVLEYDPEFAEAAATGLAFLAAQKALPEDRDLIVESINGSWMATATCVEPEAGFDSAHGPTAQAALEALTRELEAKP